MSLRPKDYETAKSRYKPLRRSGFARKPSEASGEPKPSHGLNARKGKPLKRSSGLKKKRISPEETAWRIAVLERAGHQCQWPDCAVTGAENLHAHHINERSQRPDLKFDLTNGAAICPWHHDFLHHSVMGRHRAKHLGLLGGESYELAMKRIKDEFLQRREAQP